MVRPLIGPLTALVVLAVVSIGGGLYNSVDVRGYLVDDWTDQPVKGEIRLGKRVVPTADDGSFDAGTVARGSSLQARALGYGSVSFGPERREIRLTPATLNLRVADRTDTGVPAAEARKNGRVVGRGTESGNMVIAPHPGRDEAFIVCAADLGPVEVRSHSIAETVRLLAGPGCPPLPGQSTPTPAPRPEPSERP